MARLVFAAIMALLLAVGLSSLRACQVSADKATARQVGPANLVVLDDKSVLLATDGAITQQLVDWMRTPGADRRRFEIGGRMFAAGSATPLPAASNRVIRLVEMLQAYPDVNTRVIGETQSSGVPARDQRLSEERAKAAVGLLVKFGADRRRLSITGEGASHPRYAPNSPQAAFNDRIVLELAKTR